MAKHQPKLKISNAGRPRPWSKEQTALIEASLPRWYEFSLERHKDLDGRDSVLTKWKKKEADAILGREEFSVLPENVSKLTITYSYYTEPSSSQCHPHEKR